MKNYESESLTHDPVHGYIPFVADVGLPPGEVAEQVIIDHPWVQRLRQIHQLQTAWWVFPTAEHTRFQHVIGVMHLASRAVAALYESLVEVCPDTPSIGYVESLMRMAGLLHDVGHGPFGHFLDSYFLQDYGLTHESVGAVIIEEELGPLLRRIRRNPYSQLADEEQLDPAHISLLIMRPKASGDEAEIPRWLRLLRSLFSGLYTVDNMDFVLRDAYMSGYSARSFDLERLLHYSFFSERGLTVHDRGLPTLVRFISVRGELFRSIYFHRIVRAIDLSLQDLFAKSKAFLFPGNPLEHLAEYQRFTEWSLLVDVTRWGQSDDPRQRELAGEWELFTQRKIPWQMVCERTLLFGPGHAEQQSIFSEEGLVKHKLLRMVPQVADDDIRVDLARHVHRPGTRGPTAGQNFLYDSATRQIRELSDDQMFQRIPTSYRIVRVYARTLEHHTRIADALDELMGGAGSDDLTNM